MLNDSSKVPCPVPKICSTRHPLFNIRQGSARHPDGCEAPRARPYRRKGNGYRRPSWLRCTFHSFPKQYRRTALPFNVGKKHAYDRKVDKHQRQRYRDPRMRIPQHLDFIVPKLFHIDSPCAVVEKGKISIDTARNMCYNINGEHRWRLLPH